ncbi:hypothetical protein HB852_10820 [Listeria grandensis]|uniref:hypothetical protein n=1 Tax=Listeria grandensis TaxID=1494963 RepID=UPI001628F56D|nr:hypothetical protein [Listeria grandensis]MBC1475112.1 hypothetical protein [Listeria grandensis]
MEIYNQDQFDDRLKSKIIATENEILDKICSCLEESNDIDSFICEIIRLNTIDDETNFNYFEPGTSTSIGIEVTVDNEVQEYYIPIWNCSRSFFRKVKGELNVDSMTEVSQEVHEFIESLM